MPKEQIWVSNENGRSFFGIKIKEEIFIVFFILILISLANDDNIVDKVNNNTQIQIFILFIVIYCVYNKIPWSLAFILLLLVSILFSKMIPNMIDNIKKKTIELKKNIPSNKKGILKKVQFKKPICKKVEQFIEKETFSEADTDNETEVDSDDEDELRDFLKENLNK